METDHDYTKESIFKTPFEVFHKVWIQNRILLVDIILKPGELGGTPEYSRRERWTDKSIAEINAAGYLQAVGLHDSIFWTGAKIYVKVHNLQEFDIASAYPEKKDTAYTLNDEMLSNTLRDFKKGLARAQLTATADWQKLLLMGVLGVGVIIATKIFGLW